MKNVKRCSLSGIAFTMDTDAYETLKAYIDSLRVSCGNTPDGDEIVADIEARIAELILSTRSADSVVELPLVENIIRQMGRPEEISSESEAAGEPESDGTQSGTSDKRGAAVNEPRIPRRLYRDMANAKLGGVCAGLARYFDTDPVWVRLLLMLPLLLTPTGNIADWLGQMFLNLFGMFILAYIVMWFAVPAARSARQKLEMNGERITAQSIKEATVAGTADTDSQAKPVVANVVTVFGQILLILLKILAGIIVFGLIITACALIIGMLVVIISGEGVKDFTVIVSSLGISVALLPVMLLIYVMMCLIASRKPGTKTVIGMFIVWVLAIMALIIAALHEYKNDGRHFPSYSHTRITATSEVVVDGDTVNSVRSVRENDDAEAMPDVEITFERDSARFSVTESALPEESAEEI